MKKFLSLLFLLPFAAFGQSETNAVSEQADTTEYRKSLNDIRFGDWNEDDWYDNEYYRELRKEIDAWLAGESDHGEDMEQYKQIAKGSPFGIINVEPYLLGGLYVVFVFTENPSLIFETNVYSVVDEENEKVIGYEVRGIKMIGEEPSFTKEVIYEALKQNPKHKLW